METDDQIRVVHCVTKSSKRSDQPDGWTPQRCRGPFDVARSLFTWY